MVDGPGRSLSSCNHGSLKRVIATKGQPCYDSRFAEGVPSEVSHILNVDPLSFQRQHDAPFWFGDSAGDVSKQLNEIVDLSVMDTTLANLASMTRKARAEQGVIESRIKEATREKRALRHVQEANEDLRAVEALEKEWSQERFRASRLIVLLAEGGRHQETSGKRTTALGASEELSHLESLESSWDRSKGKAKQLKEYVNVIRETMRVIQNTRESVKKAQGVLQKEMGTVCPLCGQSI